MYCEAPRSRRRSVPSKEKEKSTAIIFDVTLVYKSVKFNVDRFPLCLSTFIVRRLLCLCCIAKGHGRRMKIK